MRNLAIFVFFSPRKDVCRGGRHLKLCTIAGAVIYSKMGDALVEKDGWMFIKTHCLPVLLKVLGGLFE